MADAHAKLTDLFAERVKPPARGRVEYFDASFPGLALRVTEKWRQELVRLLSLPGTPPPVYDRPYPAIGAFAVPIMAWAAGKPPLTPVAKTPCR
jgi:hypothetical protein